MWREAFFASVVFGYFNQPLPPMLERLNIKPKIWRKHATDFEYYHANIFNREESELAAAFNTS